MGSWTYFLSLVEWPRCLLLDTPIAFIMRIFAAWGGRENNVINAALDYHVPVYSGIFKAINNNGE